MSRRTPAMLFIDNKYLQWYSALITQAINRSTPVGYTETHHIIPRSLFRQSCNNLTSDPDVPENLVILTAREHYICHKLLTKFTEGRNRYLMIYALWRMTNTNTQNQRYQISGTEYQKNRELLAEARKGKPAWNRGIPRTSQEKAKMSVAKKEALNKNGNWHLGKKRSLETRKKLSEKRKGKSAWNKGMPKTHDERAKISERVREYNKNHPNPNLGKKRNLTPEQREQISEKSRNRARVQCEHCDKTIDIAVYVRWHGDRCKSLKPIEKKKTLDLTPAQRAKISETSRNRRKIQCEFCKKVIDISIFTRCHGSRCKSINTQTD